MKIELRFEQNNACALLEYDEKLLQVQSLINTAYDK